MIKKLYALLGRALFFVASPFVQLYFKYRENRRVRVIMMNDQDEVLLVKGWFGRQSWELPGGGIERDEEPLEAAIRELHEETGLLAHDRDLQFLGEFRHEDARTPYIVVLYSGHSNDTATRSSGLRRLEIMEQGWFSIKKLPQNTAPLVSRALPRLQKVE